MIVKIMKADTCKPSDAKFTETLDALFEKKILQTLKSLYLTKWFIPKTLHNQAKIVAYNWTMTSSYSTEQIEKLTSDSLNRISEDVKLFNETLLENSVIDTFPVELEMISKCKSLIKNMLDNNCPEKSITEVMHTTEYCIVASATQKLSSAKLFD